MLTLSYYTQLHEFNPISCAFITISVVFFVIFTFYGCVLFCELFTEDRIE